MEGGEVAVGQGLRVAVGKPADQKGKASPGPISRRGPNNDYDQVKM